MKQDLLIEIGTEELPPKSLQKMAENFAGLVINKLQNKTLAYDKIEYFATPRRLAVLIHQLEPQQKDSIVKNDGPFVRIAHNEQNQPTPALEGFARKCGVAISELKIISTEQGDRYTYSFTQKGKTVKELLPDIIEEVLKTLPVGKAMRWGSNKTEFARPIHWVTLLYGKDEIKAEIAGLTSGRITYGHRFHHPEAIKLANASDYESVLEKVKVIADFDKRKKLIRKQITDIANKNFFTALTDDEDLLLDEVTGLIEWPVALHARFNPEFLEVPREALISAMHNHQKSFPLFTSLWEMQPSFITISNIESKDPAEVIRGNERVMRARLSDAKFFYDTDRKQKLETHLEGLKNVVFQKNLGTLYDKSQRIAALAEIIASQIPDINTAWVKRAGLLCKADLLTTMVGEFPELQGIMGYYYAANDGEDSEVTQGIREHYSPRFAGDQVPLKLIGSIVALADRIDTLVGIFGINQVPTGEKDPFGLRRAALGTLRILIEKDLNIDLYQLIESAKNLYALSLPNKDLTPSLYHFIIERLRAWYQDQNITPDVLTAVLTSRGNSHIPLEIHKRVLAVQAFKQLPEASALAAANKRVSNLLIKNNQLEQFTYNDPFPLIDTTLFAKPIEHELYKDISIKVNQPHNNKNYNAQLLELASLRDPVDAFFDSVMVMDENEKIRNNRLTLLAALRNLFLDIADISQLQLQ